MTDQAMTVEQFKSALPPDMQKRVNPLMVMRINNILSSSEEAEMFKDNLISHTSVLKDGKFKMSSYIDAVRYVGFKMMGLSNKEAHMKTFPEKHQAWAAQGVSAKDIASYTTGYNKNKLVNLIYDQTLIPTHILNAGAFQEAINHQMHLMRNAKSEMVQMQAANALMTHLKAPEAKKVELDVGIAVAPNVGQQYQEAMTKFVEAQMDLIQQGADVKTVTNAPIMVPEAEIIE